VRPRCHGEYSHDRVGGGKAPGCVVWRPFSGNLLLPLGHAHGVLPGPGSAVVGIQSELPCLPLGVVGEHKESSRDIRAN